MNANYKQSPFKGVTVHDYNTAQAICEDNPDLDGCYIVMESFDDTDGFYEAPIEKQYYNKPAYYDAREFDI